MKSLVADHDYVPILQRLKKFAGDVLQKALEYIPTDMRDWFTREAKKSQRCVPPNGEKCNFAESDRGGPAETKGRSATCVWHDPEKLRNMCEDANEREKLRRKLRKMHPESKRKAIEEKIPEPRRGHFEDLLPPPIDAAARPPDAAAAAPRGRRRKRSSTDEPPELEEGPISLKDAQAGLDKAREPWGEPLRKLRRAGPRPTEQETADYQRSKDAIQGRTRTKFGVAGDDRGGGAFPGDARGTGLPPATESSRAHALELYVTTGSWGICEVCHLRQPRKCVPATFDRAPSPTIKGGKQGECWRCRASTKRDYYVPKLEDMPADLRDLSEAAAAALSPLEIDTGPEIRSKSSLGFRQHAKMITFSWHAISVENHIDMELSRRDRRAAKKAFHFLYRTNTTYKKFIDEHDEFLWEHPQATPQQRKRWLPFIEREGVECALWPRLFWFKEMCFTVERATDPRRLLRGGARATAEERTRPVDPYAEPEDEGEDDDGVRHSILRSFQAKALSPLLDYGSSYEILHFVFDLSLWSTIGARASVSGNVPLRVMMKGHQSSPLYWRAVHNSLIDMIRQCGYPRIFLTIAPYGRSFPYHVSLEHQLDEMQRERGRLALPETLHKAHIMGEVVRGFVMGTNATGGGKNDCRRWKRHLLNGAPGPTKRGHARGERRGRVRKTVLKRMRVRHVTRNEFQDGTRKPTSQDYHGSGEVHLHGVSFHEQAGDARLDGVASATLPPPGTALRGVVVASQRDRKGKTPWPVHEGPNEWDEGLQRTLLRHLPDDNKEGVRAYLTEVIAVLKCHMDLQETTIDEALHAYLSKYPVKNSSGADEEWLNDAASGNSVAATVLMHYKPYEPEMVLELFGQKFRPWSVNTVSGGKRDFIVPVPDAQELPDEIKQYEECTWRGEDMCLLDFLRRTNKKGDIIKWLKDCHKDHVREKLVEAHELARKPRSERAIWEAFTKGYKRHGRGDTMAAFARAQIAQLLPDEEGPEVQELEQFAREFKMFGEQVVAADCVSWRNDKARGQWLVLHVPFRKITEFLDSEVEAKLPRELRYLGMALRCDKEKAKSTWRNADNLREELRRQGNKRVYTDAVMTQTLAETDLVYDYLAGRLVRTAADEAELLREAPPKSHFQIGPDHENSIRSGAKTIEGRIDRGPASTVCAGDVVQFGAAKVRVLEVTRHASFWDMLEHHGVEAALPGVASVWEGVRVYHGFRGYQRQAGEYGVVAFRLERLVAAPPRRLPWSALNIEQKDFVTRLRAAVDHAFAVRDADGDPDAQQRIIDSTEPHKVQVLYGPPGTGKTAAAMFVVEEVLERGGYVLFTVYTAELTSVIKKRFKGHPRRRQITIDTCHAAFHLGEDFAPNPKLADYQLWVIDEVSQLEGKQNDRIIRLRDDLNHVPAMAELGDRYQMGGFGDTRAWHTRLWRYATFTTELHQPYRCEDEAYWDILKSIRTHKPEGKAWTNIQHNFLRYNKAWDGDKPTVEDVKRLLDTYPETTFLAATRKGANTLDDLCMQARFRNKRPLAVVPGDIESWAENYNEKKELKPRKKLRRRPVPIHKGMPVYLTRNIRKDIDYVNGMKCTVLKWNEERQTVTVQTDTGKIFAVGPEPDDRLGDLVYYPLRPGFASTILKKQGTELPHVVVYLDACVRAAAYTAMSRVKFQSQCLIGGWVTPEHFLAAK